MDPRGVGASTPSLHCNRRYFGYDRPSYVPRATWIYRSWLARARNYASACASTAGKRALLPHLTTLDTVRDMELVRQALGAEKLGFYGYSYGTYLGQLYATRYPSRVGRFVLDGVVNPQRVWYAANFDQDRGFEASMNQFWLYLAKHSRDFHLGTSWRAIRSGYFRQLTLLDRKPLVGGRLGPDELHDAMLDAAYYVYDWDTLGYAYADLVRRHQGADPRPALPRRPAERRQRVRGLQRRAVHRHRLARLGTHPLGHLGGAPTRALRDLGQHLVQRALPDLARASPPQAGGVRPRGVGEDPAGQRDP